MRLFLGVVIAALSLLMAIPIAFAQETAIPASDIFGVVRPYIIEIIGVIAAAAIALVAKKISSLAGIEIEAKHREALQSALENAARLAMAHVDRKLDGKAIDVGSPALHDGIVYVIESVPDAVKYFGLSPERIADLIRPKLIPKA